MTNDTNLKLKLHSAYGTLNERLSECVVGLDEVKELLIIGVLSGGHCLLEGVPGLAKTLLISSLSEFLDLEFSRIQFTPDLMPSDIVGTEIIAADQHTGERSFRFLKGPVFANVVLADEINRTPPKTQAALMEAMEEHQVTTGGHHHGLDRPFFVLATQNPIEQEGTYPLPAAQLDRFTFMIDVSYPSRKQEYDIVRMTCAPSKRQTQKLLTKADILEFMDLAWREQAPETVIRFATTLARLTRPSEPESPEKVKRYFAWGVGPRGAQALVMAAKVRAILQGRSAASTEDVWALAPHVFRHRMILNFIGEAEGVATEDVLRDVVQRVPGASSLSLAAPRAPQRSPRHLTKSGSRSKTGHGR